MFTGEDRLDDNLLEIDKKKKKVFKSNIMWAKERQLKRLTHSSVHKGCTHINKILIK